jgi:chemotaxis protein methyltransferase CheR
MTADPAVEAAVDAVGEILDARIGLRPQSTLQGRLRRCVRDESEANGLELDVYVDELSRSGGLLQRLVDRVTVQESAFFRHPDHFDVLAATILPALAAPVTVWSAGCANGQEAYSLAMLLAEQGVDGSVLATDLSTSALARTAAATYSSREIGGLSPHRRVRHLSRAGDDWTVRSVLRSRVTSMRHNLLDGVPALAADCQVVFCRNVLIYFSPGHTEAFLDALAAALSPGAYLFLGSAESMWHVTDRFEAVRLGDSFVYRRRDDAARRPPRTAMATRPPTRTSSTRTGSGRGSGAAVRRDGHHPVRPALRTSSAPSVQSTSGGQRGVAASGASSSALPDIGALAATGRRALDAADTDAAVVAFRKWAYLAPDDPLAALHLALALEAGGHVASAQRAFGAARAAVLRSGEPIGQTELGGYAPDELIRLLDRKQVRDR